MTADDTSVPLPAELALKADRAWAEYTNVEKAWQHFRSCVHKTHGAVYQGLPETPPPCFDPLKDRYEARFSFKGLLPIYSWWQKGAGGDYRIDCYQNEPTHGPGMLSRWEVPNFGFAAYCGGLDIALALASRPDSMRGVVNGRELRGLKGAPWHGTTYRETVAAMCLQGFLATGRTESMHASELASYSLELADALIAALERKE